MNPSTQEIINAFENLPTDKVIILPNNKNIFMAAEAAKDVTVKKVAVIPCRTVPQGLAAMLRLIPDGDFDNVVEDMADAINEVETGEVTIATRSVEIDGVEVKEGEIIVLHNGKLVLSTDSLEKACLGLMETAHAEYFELVTLFSGADTSHTEVIRIADAIRNAYPELEAHKARHDELKATLDGLDQDFEEEGPTHELAKAIDTFLGNWLIKHIHEVDMKLGAFLREKAAV